jgi:peptidoglycan-associated lipoprotein
MRKSAAVAALAAVLVFPACHKHRRPEVVPQAPAPAAPAQPPPAPAPPEPNDIPPVQDDYGRLHSMDSAALEQLGLFGDIHFDLDSPDVREADKAVLSKNADTMKKYDFIKLTVEGHCDERGSAEYNLALGEKRARNASDYLVQLGVPADRLKIVSYGKEVPLCTESNEDCWMRNRRSHFAVTGKVK